MDNKADVQTLHITIYREADGDGSFYLVTDSDTGDQLAVAHDLHSALENADLHGIFMETANWVG